MKESLKQVYSRYSTPEGNGDKGTIHSYMGIYEEHIINFPGCRLLEIGICEGYSLAMWQEFLTEGEIWGADINTSRIKFDLKRCKVLNGDATKESFLKHLDANKFDYIIDDGSHFLEDQIASFKLLYKYLKEGGKYFIEDVNHINADAMRAFLDSQNVKYVCYDFVKQSKRYDDIIFLISNI